MEEELPRNYPYLFLSFKLTDEDEAFLSGFFAGEGDGESTDDKAAQAFRLGNARRKKPRCFDSDRPTYEKLNNREVGGWEVP